MRFAGETIEALRHIIASGVGVAIDRCTSLDFTYRYDCREYVIDWKCCTCGDELDHLVSITAEIADAACPPQSATEVRTAEDVIRVARERGVREHTQDLIVLRVANEIRRRGICRCRS